MKYHKVEHMWTKWFRIKNTVFGKTRNLESIRKKDIYTQGVAYLWTKNRIKNKCVSIKAFFVNIRNAIKAS